MNTKSPTNRRPLTPAEVSAAERLRGYWLVFKGRKGYESQTAIANSGPEGWNQSTVSKHMNAEVALTVEAVEYYCQIFDIPDPYEIAAGPVAELLAKAESAVNRQRLDPEQFVMVRLYESELSGGSGAASCSVDYQQIAFRREFAEAEGCAESDLVAYIVRGDSMAHQIRHSDAVIGRTDVIDRKKDGIYAFTFDGDQFVKRLKFNSDGSIILMSDNNNSGSDLPIHIPTAETKRIRLLARIFHRSGKVA